jgi:uncharacterized membrane protein
MMCDMPWITIVVGDILILLGLLTYFAWVQLGATTQSVTALIPAFIGIPIAVCGALALKPNLRKHAMHFAVLLGLIGFLASIGKFIAGRKPPTTIGPASQLIMAIVTGVFVALCIRSFIAARRRREAESVNLSP